ncbi:MAG: sugar phosphate isomerase/epimerase family protein [Candidatus Bathyarchaeia archaeon]
MRVGISTWTFGWSFGIPGYPQPETPMTLFDLLDKAKELNVSIVQMGENIPLERLDENTLNEVANKARKMDIEIEVLTFGTSPQIIQRFLEIAKVMNSKIVRTYTLNEEVAAGLQTIINNIKSVIKDYEREGVTLLLENHEEIPAKDLRFIVERIESENIGILLDTGNSYGIGEPLNYVTEVFLPYIGGVHVKEFTIKRMEHKLGFEMFGVPIGEGMINIDWLLKTLIAAEKKHIHLVIEQWTPFIKTLNATIRLEHEWAVRNVEFLKKKLKEYGVYEP